MPTGGGRRVFEPHTGASCWHSHSVALPGYKGYGLGPPRLPIGAVVCIVARSAHPSQSRGVGSGGKVIVGGTDAEWRGGRH